ncbi:MAG: 2-hydroxychromene-2-carboxylate isomerase/DsbA-like thioredoxin domain, partial [uncultured Rubrobacteraceae bacterium]
EDRRVRRRGLPVVLRWGEEARKRPARPPRPRGGATLAPVPAQAGDARRWRAVAPFRAGEVRGRGGHEAGLHPRDGGRQARRRPLRLRPGRERPQHRGRAPPDPARRRAWPGVAHGRSPLPGLLRRGPRPEQPGRPRRDGRRRRPRRGRGPRLSRRRLRHAGRLGEPAHRIGARHRRRPLLRNRRPLRRLRRPARGGLAPHARRHRGGAGFV